MCMTCSTSKLSFKLFLRDVNFGTIAYDRIAERWSQLPAHHVESKLTYLTFHSQYLNLNNSLPVLRTWPKPLPGTRQCRNVNLRWNQLTITCCYLEAVLAHSNLHVNTRVFLLCLSTLRVHDISCVYSILWSSKQNLEFLMESTFLQQSWKHIRYSIPLDWYFLRLKCTSTVCSVPQKHSQDSMRSDKWENWTFGVSTILYMYTVLH